MLNELLKKQLEKYIGEEKMPLNWEPFLQSISDTYDQFGTADTFKSELIDESAEAIKELNIRLKNEAEELKKAHNELGRILNSVNHGFFSRDIIGNNYNYLSLACERIYGYTFNDFFENSRLWYDVIHPDDRSVVDSDNDRLLNREEVYTQYRILHSDKSTKWIELTLIPSFIGDKLVRVDGVVNDITKRKEAEAERDTLMKELMKTNADLKQFSYITSHNLRSPLSNIRGILNLFEFDENDLLNRKKVDMLKVASQQLHSTIEDLTQILIIKNNVSPKPTRLELKEVLDGATQIFRSALDDIEATIFVNFNCSSIMMNKAFLESIFINLISNAIKYHSPDRKLVIKVESFEADNGFVKIVFSDNGIGIDLSRHADKIFGLYQRFHENVEGKGLGLFITKSQIEATGGKIDVESVPDEGTTFILTLNA